MPGNPFKSQGGLQFLKFGEAKKKEKEKLPFGLFLDHGICAHIVFEASFSTSAVQKIPSN